tara:strand:+ start:1745 stop:1918 length:174 start_codon:yes stop_codon:yes gene_type:complete
MNKLFAISLVTILLIGCGGGGYGGSSSGGNSSSNNPYGGSAPTGNFAGQVDPVQATD